MKKMRRLQMTANEILTSYRQAADKRMQIGVLADLNAVTKDEIEEVLRQCGEELPEKRKAKPGRPRKESVKAEEETAEKPEPIPSAASRQLPLAHKGSLPVEEAPAMSAGMLAEILRRVTEAFPEAEVAAEEGVPCGAALTVRWDAWGEIAETKLTIQTKKEEAKC